MTTLTEALEKIEPKEWILKCLSSAGGLLLGPEVKISDKFVDRDTYEKVLKVARELAKTVSKMQHEGWPNSIIVPIKNAEQDCIKILEGEK